MNISFELAWDRFSFPDFTNSFYDFTKCSCIDHFVYSRNVILLLAEASVIRSGVNTSTHDPIILTLHANSGQSNNSEEQSVPDRTSRTNVTWHRVTLNDKVAYRNALDDALAELISPEGVKCRNNDCALESHKGEINLLCDRIVVVRSQETYIYQK